MTSVVEQIEKETRIVPEAQFSWSELKETWDYRDLVILMVRRDLVATYKQTVLGPLWMMVQPLMQSGIYAIIFGKIAQISTDGQSPLLFYSIGLLMWNYFHSCMVGISNTLGSNAGLHSKVYVPKLVMPVTHVLSQMINWGVNLLPNLFLIGYFILMGGDKAPHPSAWSIIIIPLLLVQMAIMSMGIGLIFSSLTIKYRDLRYVISFVTSFWMYLTPVIYPVSQIPEQWRAWAWLNPMTAPMEISRWAMLGGSEPSMGMVICSVVFTLVSFILGLRYFEKATANFVDTI